MEERQRVWVRGVENRGEEVIQYLESLGGRNAYLQDGNNPNRIYYIDHNLYISYENYDCETSKIIRDYYKEYILPEYQFKDGDILKHKEYNNFMVYNENGEPNKTVFISYLFVNRNSCMTGTTLYAKKSDYRLATPSEIEEFNNMLQELGYEWDCDNKQLLASYWKPKYNETYYYITDNNTVGCHNWTDTDIEHIRWRANNCFKTKAEAEDKANKIKKILKEKYHYPITTDESHCIAVNIKHDKWKPSEGETFYSISTSEDCIRKYEYGYDAYTQRLVKNCNCFKTSKEAEEALNVINQFFKENTH